MSIDFRTFNNIIRFITDVKKPVLLRGRHGIGKSTVVYQYAEKIGLPVVERRASQMTEGDLVGLPSINGDCTSFNPPDWFKAACKLPVVLFLDEVDRATIEVRQGIFELTDSRKLNGHYLHPDTLIFAAVNGGEHGSQYQVGEMDPAELDRWTVFDLEPSVEDWLEWAPNAGICKEVIDFISSNNNHLEHNDDFEPNKVYPSRRSWERLNDTLSLLSFPQAGSSELRQICAAFVGFEAAVAFNDFIDNYHRQVTAEDVMDRGRIDLTENFDPNDHLSLLQKIDSSKVFEADLTDQQAVNFAEYFITLPAEIAMKAWTIMGKGKMDNTIKLHEVVLKGNRAVSDKMIEILGGDENASE
tara:strand:+ start:2129 stop:3199 length:1071 start_codon:yes stop_codon:yes gene_type:complete